MEMKDMADLLEKQAKAWDEFKSVNDTRLAEMEQPGHASDYRLAKLATSNDAIHPPGQT